jgi:hypothetical protein
MKIDKDIPVPRKYHRTDIWNEVASNMDVGDSVLVEDIGKRASLSNALKRSGYEITTRSEDKQFRVWRLT